MPFSLLLLCLFDAGIGEEASQYFAGTIGKKVMKRDFFSLSKKKATSVNIYDCFEWNCLQTDSHRYIVFTMVKLT